MVAGQLLQLVLALFIVPLVLLPAVGGGFVSLGFQIAKVPNFPYGKCWKVYLASCCYAFLALLPVGYFLQRSDLGLWAKQGIQLGVFCGLQLIFVPLFLRTFSARALAAVGVAIVLTNLVTFAVLLHLQNS
jgi:hypothetical protein